MGQRRAAITRRLAEGGVSLPGPVHEMPIHHQPVFGGAYGGLAFPEAESFSYGHLCLPLYPTITEEEQITVAARSWRRPRPPCWGGRLKAHD